MKNKMKIDFRNKITVKYIFDLKASALWFLLS